MEIIVSNWEQEADLYKQFGISSVDDETNEWVLNFVVILRKMEMEVNKGFCCWANDGLGRLTLT